MALFDILGGDKPKKPVAKTTDPNEDERIAVNKVLNTKSPYDNDLLINLVKKSAQRYGLNPEMLAASAIQEGMGLKFINTFKNNSKDEYPVNGFAYFGLDRIGEKYDDLEKKGYLKFSPKDYDVITGVNEKGTEVESFVFKNVQDALNSKAAMMKDVEDSIKAEAKKRNMSLEPRTLQYLTMAAYNGGLGNARIMIDEIASKKYNQSDFVNKGLTSRQGVHKNLAPRLMKMGWISNELNKMR